jgi:DNA-binding NarL/FixJ family response regulator
MPSKTILLIDDHSLFRRGLRALIQSGLDDIDIIESDSLEAAMQAPNTALQLILLDIKLQGLNGLEGAAMLKRKWADCPIIVISADSSPGTVRLAHEKGACHFISKASSADDILQLISQVLNDTDKLPATKSEEYSPNSATHKPLLTPRQYEVLDLLCKGLSNKMIARQLDLSENTVRCHVQVLLGAFKATNRSEAAFTARRMGLVT